MLFTGGRRAPSPQRDPAHEYLSSLPGSPDTHLPGECSCHFIFTSCHHPVQYNAGLLHT